MTFEKRLSGFLKALSKATDDYQICLYSFSFKDIGEDIEVTVIDQEANQLFDILMRPGSMDVVEAGEFVP